MMNQKNGKINVLFITRNLEFGGVERRVATLAEYMNRERFNVHVACMRNGGTYAEQLKMKGFPCYNLNMPLQYNPMVIRKLKNLIQSLNIDVIDCHQTRANIWGTRAGKYAGAPVILSSNYLIRNWKNVFLKNLEIGGFRLSDKLITDSQQLKDEILSKTDFESDFIEVIPNGVPEPDIQWEEVGILKKKYQFQSEQIVIGMVGRLVPYKGQMLLLRSFAQIAHQFPNIKVLIVGKEGEKGYLKKLHDFVRLENLENRVTITEYSGNILNIMFMMDIFILPSSGESLPISILESLSLGKPVIASNIGGVKNAVRDGVNGFLIPEKDDTALAKRISIMASDPALIKRFSQKSRQIYEEDYQVDKMVGRVEELYAKIYSLKVSQTIKQES